MNSFSPSWILRWCASLLLSIFAAIGCLAQPPAEAAHKKIPIQALSARESLPLAISCSANPTQIRPGEVSRIFATAVSPQNRPLTFSYMASAGSISGGGGSAVFSSIGAPPGAIEITCRVSDDQGRAATSRVTVAIVAPMMAPPPPQMHAPNYPAVTQSAPVHLPSPAGAAPSQTTQPLHVESAQLPAAAQSCEYSEGYEVEAWKKGLKQGQIEYAVPARMKAQVQAPVTVKIHGFQDVSGAQPLIGATGGGTLKVSSYMKVELLAPQNPGEFNIVSQSSEAVQFVPNDGSATWNWVVTPAYEAKNQQLEIRVSLIYKRADTTLEDSVEDKNYTVNVEVQKLTTTVWQDFQKDPIAFIKYMMPGGAGWAAIAALVTSLGGFAWWKRMKKKAVHHPHVR